MSDFVRQFVTTALLGFLPFAQAGQPDLVLTMDSNNAMTLQETPRIISSHGPATGVVPRQKGDSLGIKVQSQAALLLDVGSGRVLWQKSPYQTLPIASLTKLLTLNLVIQQQPDWQREYALQPDENLLVGAKLREPDGVRVRVDDLFGAALVGSANNATLATARATGLTDEAFVEKMNQQLQAWGLDNSHFVEPTGLEQANVSTARDYARIALEAFQQDKIRNLADERIYDFTIAANNSHHEVKSTNPIFDSSLKVLGTKTGFTYEAGYCLVTLVEQDGHELLIVTLGSPSDEGRLNDTKALAEWAVNNFEW